MKVAKKAFICIIVFTVICGLVYPLVMTGISQVLFKDKANYFPDYISFIYPSIYTAMSSRCFYAFDR